MRDLFDKLKLSHAEKEAEKHRSGQCRCVEYADCESRRRSHVITIRQIERARDERGQG